jgi:hypothetical protein
LADALTGRTKSAHIAYNVPMSTEQRRSIQAWHIIVGAAAVAALSAFVWQTGLWEFPLNLMVVIIQGIKVLT